MPDASVRLAREVSEVRTPEHLIPRRTRVRTDYRAALSEVHAAIDRRFGTTGASQDFVNAFYAASEMALMERVGRENLSPEDRRALRHLWEDLLSAT